MAWSRNILVKPNQTRHPMETRSALLRGIHWSPNSSHKEPIARSFDNSLMYAWTNGWTTGNSPVICDAMTVMWCHCNALLKVTAWRLFKKIHSLKCWLCKLRPFSSHLKVQCDGCELGLILLLSTYIMFGAGIISFFGRMPRPKGSITH